MLCERCKKRQSTVKAEMQFNGGKTEYFLCAECAAELDIQLDFSKFLNGLLGTVFAGAGGNPEEEKVCRTCGLSLSRFEKIGRFGCSDCYRYFEPKTGDILRKVHGGNMHIGKIPGKLKSTYGQVREIEKLKKLLKDAVANEEFEKAAEYRDSIRELDHAPGKGGEA